MQFCVSIIIVEKKKNIRRRIIYYHYYYCVPTYIAYLSNRYDARVT